MKSNYKKLMLFLCVILMLTCLSSCVDVETDQEKIADIVQEQYSDIYGSFSDYSYSMSMEDAESILWCYADKNSGMEYSEDEIREAIWTVLEYREKVDDLIYSIDDIDIE